MSTPGAVVTVRCHYCSKGRNPREVLPLSGGAVMCWRCHEWHARALKALAGEPPPGCQECGLGFGELEKRAASGNVRMYLHAKDGVYQVLCQACSDHYERKRVDLYGDTDYGRAKKLGVRC